MRGADHKLVYTSFTYTDKTYKKDNTSLILVTFYSVFSMTIAVVVAVEF